MNRILVVGSGASGVHFALTLLKKGQQVTMLDVGHPKARVNDFVGNFNALKETLVDPTPYFLGQEYEAVVYPGSEPDYYTKYYGFPPSKSYVFSQVAGSAVEATGFQPLMSYAQGGLAEAWTAGVYPLNDAELQAFPFGYSEMEPHYAEVCQRIGITGVADDLARFFPVHDHLLQPLRLDSHSQGLLARYAEHKEYLNHHLNCYMGRSRVATLSENRGERSACTYCGRCLWGCPSASIYTPSSTLRECQRYANFEYVPDMYVSHFRYDESGKVVGLVAHSTEGNLPREWQADRFVLAAGALSSSKIFMESVRRATGQVIRLRGLMDNRQILIPFVNLAMIGKRYSPENYQYHQVAMGIVSDKPEEYIHGQITTLKTALVHPIVHNVPLDLRTALFMFKNVRAGLGVVNLNLYDRRRDDNYVTLEETPRSDQTKLTIHYTPGGDEEDFIKRSVKTVKQALFRLGCIVPPGMTHVRPMGASVHYTGTLPMTTDKAPLTVSKYCQSHDFDNLYLVDGATFPFLPAKNVTFSLMANAVRVAAHAF